MAYTKNATEKAYIFIQDKIESGEWKPGDKIWTEAMLCKELQISRVAVRQALNKLVSLSVVYCIQGSGTYVQAPKPQEDLDLGFDGVVYDDLISILEYRRYYECGNVALFIRNATQEDIEELERQYEIMKGCGDDMEAFYTADYHFHDIIAKGTKKEFIFRISNSLNKVLLRHQEHVNLWIGPDIGLEYHEFILKYIKEKDVDFATMYMQKHIDATIQAVQENRKKHRSSEKNEK